MFISTLSSRVRRAALVAASAGAISLFSAGASTQAPRFYPDDPIAREPESRDASKAAPYEQSQMYELLFNLFVNSGHEPSGLRAKNINTIDEVPDSSWFTNRIGTPADHDRRNHARPDRRSAARSVEMGADPREDGGRASRLHGDGRAAARPGSSQFDPNWAPGAATGAVVDRHQDLLGARLQPGRVVPDDVRSEERHHRPEGDGAAPERQADAVHPRRHERHPRERPRAIPMAPTASSPAACCPARFSAASSTPAPVPTIPTISCRTSTAASCAALRVFGAWTNLTDLEGRQHDRHGRHRERQGDRQALPAGRRLDLRHVQRPPRVGPELGVLLRRAAVAKAPVHARVRHEPVADRRLRRIPARSASSRARSSTRGSGGRRRRRSRTWRCATTMRSGPLAAWQPSPTI